MNRVMATKSKEARVELSQVLKSSIAHSTLAHNIAICQATPTLREDNRRLRMHEAIPQLNSFLYNRNAQLFGQDSKT